MLRTRDDTGPPPDPCRPDLRAVQSVARFSQMQSPFSLSQRRFRRINARLDGRDKEEEAQGTSDIRQVVTFSSVVQIASRSPPVVLRQMVCPTVQSRPSARQVHCGSWTGGPGVKGWRRTGSDDWPKAGQQISAKRRTEANLRMA